jgi:hypothetical protein
MEKILQRDALFVVFAENRAMNQPDIFTLL